MLEASAAAEVAVGPWPHRDAAATGLAVDVVVVEVVVLVIEVVAVVIEEACVLIVEGAVVRGWMTGGVTAEGAGPDVSLGPEASPAASRRTDTSLSDGQPSDTR